MVHQSLGPLLIMAFLFHIARAKIIRHCVGYNLAFLGRIDQTLITNVVTQLDARHRSKSKDEHSNEELLKTFMNIKQQDQTLKGSIDQLENEAVANVKLHMKDIWNKPYVKAFFKYPGETPYQLIDSLRGKTFDYKVEAASIDDSNILRVQLYPPRQLLEYTNPDMLLKKIISQSVYQAELLDDKKRISITILKLDYPLAFCLISSIDLIGILDYRNLSQRLAIGSSFNGRVDRLVHASNLHFYGMKSLSTALELIKADLINTKVILLTLKPSSEIKDSYHQKEKTEMIGLQSTSKFIRDNKDELLEEDLLELLESNDYNKLKRNRIKNLETETTYVEEELMSLQEEDIDLEEKLRDPNRRNLLTNHFLEGYFDRMRSKIRRLTQSELKNIRNKIIYNKSHQEIVGEHSTGASSTSEKAPITEKFIEKMTWLSQEVKEDLKKLFVYNIDPLDKLNDLLGFKNNTIVESKANTNIIPKGKLPADVEKRLEEQLNQRNLPPSERKINPNKKFESEEDDPLFRVKKFDSLIRRSLEKKKAPVIEFDSSDFSYPEEYDHPNQNKGNISDKNLIYIPIPKSP